MRYEKEVASSKITHKLDRIASPTEVHLPAIEEKGNIFRDHGDVGSNSLLEIVTRKL